MSEILIKDVDEKIYYEKLSNGLRVYIYKKKNYAKKGAFFATNYGSNKNDFIPIGEKEMVSFPKGIAHFLEHKLFESEDNEKTFDKFKKYGAYLNAYTNLNITNYYFSTVYNFEECLTELINLVQNPYFTDENVEKEKGIINQEINMTNDNIDRFLFERIRKNALNVNPNKYSVIGDKQNVSRITKEDLYRCYNTFYHPSNMFLVIYGDVDVYKTIKLVKETQEKKKFKKEEKIKLKEYKESKNVKIPFEQCYKKVTNPRIMVCYKFKIPKLTELEKYKKSMFIGTFCDMKFGGTSQFERCLLKNKIIKTNLSWSFSIYDDVILLYITTTTNKKDEFLKTLDEKLRKNDLEKHIFELLKKANVASFVKDFENPLSVANMIINQVNKYGDLQEDMYNIYKNYEFEELQSEVKTLNFDNKAILYVTNKEV